ncbi:MAG: ATP-binding protein [Candidatus Marsarchaeota archaeon]|nr:ATP-binding protein [Candidatus Marsarchaeota archaeon]
MKEIHRFVLIAGASGSGKTTLKNYFQSMGKNVLDGDTEGIGIWVDEKGNQRKEPSKEEWETRKGFDWRWDISALKRVLETYSGQEVYAFSDAANLNEVRFLFDELYWLSADYELIEERLHKRAKDESAEKIQGAAYGATDEQRKYVLKKLEAGEVWAKEKGFIFVDASLSPEELFDIITKRNGKKRTS